MDKVFLDTCVLYPPILRDLLLGLADIGLYTPMWSQGVAAEWVHVMARRGQTGAVEALERMSLRWPDGIAPRGEPDVLDLPDPADRHVLASAHAGGAGVLLTLNLRDFPRRAVAPLGVVVTAPDEFTMALWLAHPQPVEDQVTRVWPGLRGRALRNALKRAGLPRLGKALEV